MKQTEKVINEDNFPVDTFNLGDIPDLSNLNGGSTSDFAPLTDGWYAGTILGERIFEDKAGNTRIFESSDTVSQKGDSRNIRLQVELVRRSDKRTFNVGTLINYKPENLTSAMVQAIAAKREENKESGEDNWGDLFGPFMQLQRLGELQKIAQVRQLQRNGDGGLDLTPLYGKKAFFKLRPDSRNPQYKEVAAFQVKEPKKVPVL